MSTLSSSFPYFGKSPVVSKSVINPFLSFIGFNFIIEFVVNSALSPVVLRLASLSKLVKNEENE